MATILALALDALVGVDGRPQTLLALAPDAVVLAYLRAPAVLACGLDTLVGAGARPQALLARVPDAVMLAYLRASAVLCTCSFGGYACICQKAFLRVLRQIGPRWWVDVSLGTDERATGRHTSVCPLASMRT